MSKIFKQHFTVRWGDIDFNAHMANTAYLNVASDTRMIYFEEQGFSVQNFLQLHIGPVVMKDELDYYRELRLYDEFEVQLLIGGLSEDGSRFRFRNDFYRSDQVLAASVTTTDGWLDLDKRSLIPPPPKLLETLQQLGRTKDFEILSNSSK